MILGEKFKSPDFFATSSTAVPDIFFSPLSPRSWLYVRDQVLHPYKATAGTIILYVSIFKFLHTQRDEDVF
jgi:hypothetical protein